MVARGWATHVHGQGRPFKTAREAITAFRAEKPGVIDQDLPAFVIAENGKPVGAIQDNDSVVFFNFRGDRAIEISKAFEYDDFKFFDRGRRPKVLYAGMMQYDGDLKLPARFLVTPPAIDRTMGEICAANGITQLAVSETQKFGHVTYFWNGNRSGYFNKDRETYFEVPSDRVSFEERPWMKAAEITDTVIKELQTGKHRFARLNYPNGDMVGHTGDFPSAVCAVQAVDISLNRLLHTVKALKGMAIVTADHGNADEMYEIDKKTGKAKRDANGVPKAKTSHTLNPVPCIFYYPDQAPVMKLNPGAGKATLANLASTAFNLMGYQAPDFYLPSLINFS
jgi:2,3-bisphosphoglycerate-independent phosphoglycerate mutase